MLDKEAANSTQVRYPDDAHSSPGRAALLDRVGENPQVSLQQAAMRARFLASGAAKSPQVRSTDDAHSRPGRAAMLDRLVENPRVSLQQAAMRARLWRG